MPKKTSTPAALGDGTPVKVPDVVATVGCAPAPAAGRRAAASRSPTPIARRRPPPRRLVAVESQSCSAELIRAFLPQSRAPVEPTLSRGTPQSMYPGSDDAGDATGGQAKFEFLTISISAADRPSLLEGGPKVRIRFPPAVSSTNHRFLGGGDTD